MEPADKYPALSPHNGCGAPGHTHGRDEAAAGASRHALQWWPALAALAFAAFVTLDMMRSGAHGRDLASVVAASGLVYLAAAALRRPQAAWPVFFLSVAVITAARFGLTGFDATWALLGLAALSLAYGWLREARDAAGGLPLQAAGMAAFGAVAAVALYLDEAAGAYLVAAGLVAHAAWDVHHHRANKVVARSLAEFCCVVDIALALAIVGVTLRA